MALIDVLQELAGTKKILVAGDYMVDRYIYGVVDRISPEAPVPVFDITKEEYILGGAGNVFSNISSLGVKVAPFGYGSNLLRDLLFENGLDPDMDMMLYITRMYCPEWVTKTRYIAEGLNQCLLRVDNDRVVFKQVSDHDLAKDGLSRLGKYTISHFEYDGIILSDYNGTFLSNDLVRKLIGLAKEKEIPVFVDSRREDLEIFKGADYYTPNMKEYRLTKLKAPNFFNYILRTEGKDGMSLFDKNSRPVCHEPAREQQVFDVTGAGDTAVSVFALCVICGLSHQESISVANAACAVVCTKPGTASATWEEINGIF